MGLFQVFFLRPPPPPQCVPQPTEVSGCGHPGSTTRLQPFCGVVPSCLPDEEAAESLPSMVSWLAPDAEPALRPDTPYQVNPRLNSGTAAPHLAADLACLDKRLMRWSRSVRSAIARSGG